MNDLGMTLGIISGIVVMVLTFKMFFGCKNEFFRCVKFWLKPDFISMLNGEYFEDSWAEFKLGGWVALGVGTSILVSRFFI